MTYITFNFNKGQKQFLGENIEILKSLEVLGIIRIKSQHNIVTLSSCAWYWHLIETFVEITLTCQCSSDQSAKLLSYLT